MIVIEYPVKILRHPFDSCFFGFLLNLQMGINKLKNRIDMPVNSML